MFMLRRNVPDGHGDTIKNPYFCHRKFGVTALALHQQMNESIKRDAFW